MVLGANNYAQEHLHYFQFPVLFSVYILNGQKWATHILKIKFCQKKLPMGATTPFQTCTGCHELPWSGSGLKNRGWGFLR